MLAKFSDGFVRNAGGLILQFGDMSTEASWSHGSFVLTARDRTCTSYQMVRRPSELIADIGKEMSPSRHVLLVVGVLTTLGGYVSLLLCVAELR